MGWKSFFYKQYLIGADVVRRVFVRLVFSCSMLCSSVDKDAK